MSSDWPSKLRRLQQNLGSSEEQPLTQEQLAGQLGITSRTLLDFMKGVREPTGPVARLIEILLAENRPTEPRLSLVVIDNDFVDDLPMANGQDPVDAIVKMHSHDIRNNEFIYVSALPAHAKWVMEGLMGRGIRPHFFGWPAEVDTPEARACYFTATTVWLAAQAVERDLTRVTLVADPKKFWPIALALTENAKVKVAFVGQALTDKDQNLKGFLDGIRIEVEDPAGRRFGFVSALQERTRPDGVKEIPWGWITPGSKGPNGERKPDDARDLFFSFNHMKKDRSGNPEMRIQDLAPGDFVSFSLGMNHKGPCAIDVALVQRASGAPPLEERPISTRGTGATTDEEEVLVDIIKEAVPVCADKEGWALLADVGSRISVLYPDYKERVAGAGVRRIGELARRHAEVFEVSDHGAGTRHRAACVRLKT